jgi:hypothetical protein
VSAAALVAVAASVAAGLVTVQPDEYDYWFTWAKLRFVLGFLALLGVYAGAGLFGYGIFQLVETGGSAASAAALEGLAGHAALRAQFERFGLANEQPSGGKSILSATRRWILAWINHGATKAIRRRLDALENDALSKLALQIFWEFTEQHTSKRSGAALHTRLADAASRLTLGDTVDARAELRGYCLSMIQQHRLALSGTA